MSDGSDDDATRSWFSRFGSVSLERSRVVALAAHSSKNGKILRTHIKFVKLKQRKVVVPGFMLIVSFAAR